MKPDAYLSEIAKWIRLATLVFSIGMTTRDPARRDRCRELHRKYAHQLRQAVARAKKHGAVAQTGRAPR